MPVFLRLVLLFTIVPLVELYLLVKMGTVVGVAPTVALVIFTGIIGAWLARVQGLGVVQRLGTDMAEGRLPTDALIDGLLILVAGAVLLTPGLLTDAVGFVLLVPRGRAVVRRIVAARFARRFKPQDPNVIDVDWHHEN